jgi:hypothetical protein
MVVPPWIGAVILAVGVLVLIRAGRTLLLARRRGRTWVRRDGRVVSSRLDDGAFRYQVAYQDGAQEIRFWNRFTSGTGIDPVGREVTVLVNPADPRDAVVERGAAGAGTAAAAFAVFGLIAVTVGFLLLNR